jgi:hypothetical protein
VVAAVMAAPGIMSMRSKKEEAVVMRDSLDSLGGL